MTDKRSSIRLFPPGVVLVDSGSIAPRSPELATFIVGGTMQLLQ